MRTSILATVVVAPLLLAACAGPRTEVITTSTPNVKFQDFKTYAFVPADRLDMTGSQMADPVTRRNLEAAIGRELQARGLSLASPETRPSVLVSYFADVFEGPDKNRPVSGSSGGDNWQRQGTLAVDVVHESTQQVVWHGEAWVRDPNVKIAEQLVAELMRKYPAR